MHFTFSLGIELALMVLLAFTLVYCIVLERRLAALRSGQDGLKATFGELNTALLAAATTVRALKQSAADAGEQLDERLSRARSLADELALITASGERIAERFDRAPAPKMAMPAGAMSNRLEALRAVR
jgi:hypothetical protein